MELSSFVGRRREVAEAKAALTTSRLVTLTGVGGVGKTRLARRVAAELRRAFPDGVWFADLTMLGATATAAQVAQSIASALMLCEQSARSPVDVLCGQIAGRRLLLVLDNCEHLTSVCALLVDTLLHAGPALRVLVTSRSSLRISGETLIPVPPMPVPSGPPVLADMITSDAVALFVARAGAAVPGFRLTEENAGAVTGICDRLDGLPLAIELAAARLRVISPDQILARLTDRFALLTGGRPTAPGRQQTLEACVEWSYEQCSETEQRMWARLSVFAGGFELDAVEGICADEALPAYELLDCMASLVDKSILTCVDQGETARYLMLETLRAFAEDRLVNAGERTELRRRHAEWYQQLVARAKAEWIGDQQGHWLARLDREQPNLRAAVEFCLHEPGWAEAAVALVTSFPLLYWRLRGLFSEGRRWLDRALTPSAPPTALNTRAMLLASHLAVWQGDVDSALPLLEQGHDRARRLGAVNELAFACLVRGLARLYRNDVTGSVGDLEQGLAILSAAPRPELELRLDLLNVLGVATGLAPDQRRAVACHRDMLDITEPRGEGFYRSRALWAHGLAAWRDGNLQKAAERERESLLIKRSHGSADRYGTAHCLEALAWITAGQQDHQRAAVLLGAADGIWTELGTPYASNEFMIGYHDECRRQCREALGDTQFHQLFRRGSGLTLEEALEYAIQRPRPSAAPKPPPASTPLTRRERQVADLVARGFSNREIAGALVISQRTAEGHVENILAKLGFTSRAQVPAWVAGKSREETDQLAT